MELENRDGTDGAVTFRSVVDRWLFDDVGEALPEVLLLPLENPDLHEWDAWDGVVVIEQRYRSLMIGAINGRRVGLLNPKLGGPAVAMVVDAAAEAIAEDGTTRAYVPETLSGNCGPQVGQRLLEAGGPGVHECLVWSMDAVLTQDSSFVRRAGKLGLTPSTWRPPPYSLWPG